MKRKYIKPTEEAIKASLKIPGLTMLERVLAAEAIAQADELVKEASEAIAFTDKIIQKGRERS